jgi:hypothetical protein
MKKKQKRNSRANGSGKVESAPENSSSQRHYYGWTGNAESSASVGRNETGRFAIPQGPDSDWPERPSPDAEARKNSESGENQTDTSASVKPPARRKKAKS